MEKQLKVTEFSIPVPWGIIAGKAYGDELDIPVLCTHGLQDNCDTLSRLIPLLPKSFYYVCIDLPGHGKSSHFPQGLMLDLLMYVFAIKRVVDHFKWTKIHYLAHSVGGSVGIYFACLFPEHVEKLVTIDTIPPALVESEHTVNYFRTRFAKLREIEKRLRESRPPTYTMDEIVERMKKSRRTELRSEHVASFVGRSLVRMEPDLYLLTTDQRLKMGLQVILNGKQVEEVLKGAVCPMLMIEAKVKCDNPLYWQDPTRFYQTHLEKRKNVVFYYVNGDHDVHLVHPELLEPVIKSFLLSQNSRL